MLDSGATQHIKYLRRYTKCEDNSPVKVYFAHTAQKKHPIQLPVHLAQTSLKKTPDSATLIVSIDTQIEVQNVQ